MSSLRFPVRALLLTATVISVGATSPAAIAAGFSAPRAISPTAAVADEPVVAVAPDGRTAVVWLQWDRSFEHPRYVAAIGRTPARLRRATTIRAASEVTDGPDDPTLTALPTGGFALCLDRTETRRRTSVGCAFATRSGGFGPLRTVSTRPSREVPALLAAARPDGTLQIVTTRRVAAGTRALRSMVLRPSGRTQYSRSLATIKSGPDDLIDLATAADGTAAVSWTTPIGGRFSGMRSPVLRLQGPTEMQFGAPVPFGAPTTISSYLAVQGGRDLLVSYAAGGPTQVVRRHPDGRFDAPLVLPRVDGEPPDGPIVQLADGSPFTVAAAGRQSGTDCDDLSRSVVGAGPLVPFGTTAPAQQLSTARQIAHEPTAGALRDGTVVAAWGDSDGDPSRLEVAIRPRGASTFDPARPLPAPAARNFALAVGGDQAVLAWLTGNRLEGPAHVVVSRLRRNGPYAPRAPRPTRPSAPCS